MFQENKAKRSPMQIIGLVVIFILALLIVMTFVIFGMFKDSSKAPKLFGYCIFVVDNNRMEPRIPEGAAVFVEEGTRPDPSKQSVILCKIDEKLWVIGCVGTQETESGELSYLVKYDNDTDDKTWGIKESDIIGVAKTQDKFVGSVIRFASSKAGMMTIVIIPCLLVIIYEVVMIVIGSRGFGRKREANGLRKSSSKSKNKRIADQKTEHGYNEIIRTAVSSIDPEDIAPEREDIHAPIDPVKEERYVEKQLRRANDRLNDTIKEETGVIEGDEVKIEKINVEPDVIIKRTDILREGAQTMEQLRPEAERIAQNLSAESVSKPSTAAYSPTKQTEAANDASSVIGDLSAAKIDELIKLLEEEKRRLGDK